MSEQELKLHVPAASRQAVEHAIKQGQAQQIHLHALYFDTPERELARARIAIRLRKEGQNWVQTLKTPGANSISRVELNHPRPGPILDLSVYAGTDVESALSQIQGELAVRYETDVHRLQSYIEHPAGLIELAYDTGVLRAGNLELPICEVEFELVSGHADAIFGVARRWQQDHALILDARSKSERGDALAQLAHTLDHLHGKEQDQIDARAQAIAAFWAPTTAHKVHLTPKHSDSQALSLITEECLDQIIRNTTVLAEVDTAGVYPAATAEHVHQLRVGIRRLRSAWRLFKTGLQLPQETTQQQLRQAFALLGQDRDQDVLRESITPQLLKAGMPTVTLTSPTLSQNQSLGVATSREFQTCLLDILEWSLDIQAKAPSDRPAGDSALPPLPAIIPLTLPQAGHDLRKPLSRRLRRWHSQLIKQGLHFAQLPVAERHELRKLAKRLRYGLHFAESLLAPNALRPYRKQLALIQDLLGEFNDLALAHDIYQQHAVAYPQAWFAVGWISARQQQLSEQTQDAFKRLNKTPGFWKS